MWPRGSPAATRTENQCFPIKYERFRSLARTDSALVPVEQVQTNVRISDGPKVRETSHARRFLIERVVGFHNNPSYDPWGRVRSRADFPGSKKGWKNTSERWDWSTTHGADNIRTL